MKIMTCREASEALRGEYELTPGRLKRACLAGKYPSMKIGNRLLVDLDVLRPILAGEQQEQQLLSTGDLALRIGLSESGIRRAVADGWLPCRIIGRNMRFDLVEVQRAIEARMQAKFDE